MYESRVGVNLAMGDTSILPMEKTLRLTKTETIHIKNKCYISKLGDKRLIIEELSAIQAYQTDILYNKSPQKKTY